MSNLALYKFKKIMISILGAPVWEPVHNFKRGSTNTPKTVQPAPLPATNLGASMVIDTPSWCGRSEVLVRDEWPARWEPPEEGMMSIAAYFPSVKKTKVYRSGEKQTMTTEGDAC
jgi:hypothetical protein